MGTYQTDQFVMVSIPERTSLELLAYVETVLPSVPLLDLIPGEPNEFYEVVCLSDHNPTSSADPISVVSAESMRSATVEEVEAQKTAWEVEHQKKLPFRVEAREDRVFIVY